MSSVLKTLAEGPRTSDPVDLVPWLRKTKTALGALPERDSVAALSASLDDVMAGSPEIEVAERLLHSQLLALYELVNALADARSALALANPNDPSLEAIDQHIGALARAYQALRSGSTADRAAIEQELARLQKA